MPATPPTDPLLTQRVPRALVEFLRTEAASGVAVLVAAVVAVVWANSPWADAYHHLVELSADVDLGGTTPHLTLDAVVNDLLMAGFFFLVSLEIKRELVGGELRSWRAASLPVLCAVGGMIVPAALYSAINAGRPGSHGWGIPMATDIAFAVGALAVVSSRVPRSLKLFLLTLAVVDDLGAIVVIAVFYSSGVNAVALTIAVVLVATVYGMRRAHVRWWPAYVVPVAGVWLATHASGVHATIAGVALALTVSTRTAAAPVAPIRRRFVADDPPSSAAERFEHALHPAVSFGIVPLFALLNAGVALSGDAFTAAGATPVALGVGVGLVAGKAIGITGAAWLAIRVGVSRRPEGTTWSHLVGASLLAGIGFTVALFVTNLAFSDPALVAPAKVAILAASAVAAAAGTLTLLATRSRPSAT